jgi:hypothetical protein
MAKFLGKYIAVEYSDNTPQEMHVSSVGTRACSKVATKGGWTRNKQTAVEHLSAIHANENHSKSSDICAA